MTTGRPELEAADSDSVSDARRPTAHIPVLVNAVLAALAPRDNAIYVDATFGAGGYSVALLGAARCRVFGMDRDPEAVRAGASWLGLWADD